MSEQHLGLHRYEGLYLIDWQWRDGKDVSRFANVKVNGDHLAMEYQSVSVPIGVGFVALDDPLVERESSEARPLAAAGEHTFDAGDRPRSYRFVLGDDDVATSVIVIRDGVSSDPCPRFAPLPEQIADRREGCEWFDLGHPTLCMTAKDTEALTSFYERLGFVCLTERRNNVRQGWTVIGFLDFQPQPCINYRGRSIAATAFELARRGYVLANGQVRASHIQADEAGSFMVYDPDGHRIFFNTHAPERPLYDAWTNGALPDAEAAGGWNVGASTEQNTMDAPVTLPLGDLVVCLDVTNLGASVDFYRGMGFETIDQTPVCATLFSRPVRENRLAFPIRLREAAEPRYSFGFLCPDVEGVSAEVRARGIEIIAAPDGPAFVDPDGNCVTLLPALSTTHSSD